MRPARPCDESRPTHVGRAPRAASRVGFTLIELATTLGIVALLASLAVVSVHDMQQRGRSRSVIQGFLSIAHEARSAALLVGAAAGTPRTSLDPNGSCPAAFSVNGVARPGMMIAPDTRTPCTGGPPCCPNGTPCDAVTYVSFALRDASVPSNTSWAGDRYTLFCRTIDLRHDASGAAHLDSAGWITRSPSPPYAITYDSRGFLMTPPPAGLVRVPFRDTDSARLAHAVLILGSGLPCLEGEANQCAQNLR